MKLTCKRLPLLSACQTAFKVASTKGIKPVLACVKLSAKDGVCTLSATDLELWIRVKTDIESCEDGEAILPPKFLKIMQESDSEDVSVDVDDAKCNVKLAKGGFDMPNVPVSEFPGFEETDFANAIEIEGEALSEMVSKTVFAAGQSGDSRVGQVTNGIFLAVNDSRFVMAASRSNMLSTMSCQVKSANTPNKVATKRFLEVAQANANGTASLHLGLDNAIAIKTGNVELRSKLIDGRYPRWEQMLSIKPAFRATISGDSLRSAIRQAAIMTDDTTNRVTFAFTPGKLSLTASGSVHGKSSLEIDVACDGSLTMMFNPEIWLSLLSRIDGEIDFAGVNDRSPALISQGDFRFLAVPMFME